MTQDVSKRFKIFQQLGEGSFSKIYHAFDKKLKIDVAIKVEKEDKHKKILKIEYEILKSLQGLNHVPIVYDFVDNSPTKATEGKEASQTQNSTTGITGLNFIVMELLGKNVANFKKSCQSFSHLIAYEILIQMLDAIEDLHERGYIHRDIKPANFVIKEIRNVPNNLTINNISKKDQSDSNSVPHNSKNNLKIYMVDYGLAKVHLDKNSRPLPPKLNTDFRGTLTYASLNAHYKKELSRRDDLWSFFFVILDLLNENLPWRTCKDDKDDIKKVKEICLADAEKKLLLTTTKGKIEILEILNHLKTLNYCDMPNYHFIRKKLNDLKCGEYYRLNGFPNTVNSNLGLGEMANCIGKNIGELELMSYLNKDNYLFQNFGYSTTGRLENLSNNYTNSNNFYHNKNARSILNNNINNVNNNLNNFQFMLNSDKPYSNLLNFQNFTHDLNQNNKFTSQNPYDMLDNQLKTNFLIANQNLQNYQDINHIPFIQNTINNNENMNNFNIDLDFLNNFCIPENNPGGNNNNNNDNSILLNKLKISNINSINNINNLNNINPVQSQYIEGFIHNLRKNSGNLTNCAQNQVPPNLNNYNMIESNNYYLNQMNPLMHPHESNYMNNTSFQFFNQNSNNLPVNINVNPVIPVNLLNTGMPNQDPFKNNLINNAIAGNQYEENLSMNLNLNKKRKRDESEEFVISNNNNTAKNQIFIINQFNKNYLTELERKLLDILIKNNNANSKSSINNENFYDMNSEMKINLNSNIQHKANEKNQTHLSSQPVNNRPKSKNEYDINNCDKNLINSITQKLNPIVKNSKNNVNAASINSKTEEKTIFNKNETDKNLNSNLLIKQLNLILDQNKQMNPLSLEHFLNNNLMKDIMNQDVYNIISNCIYNKNLMGNENTAQKQINNLDKDKISPNVKSFNNCKNITRNVSECGYDKFPKRLIFKIEKNKKRVNINI